MHIKDKQGSPLSRSVSAFANATAGICTFLAAPQITKYVRPEMYKYLAEEFAYDIAHWGSWGFVVLLGLCVFFGLTALFQMLVQLMFHRGMRKSAI